MVEFADHGQLRRSYLGRNTLALLDLAEEVELLRGPAPLRAKTA